MTTTSEYTKPRRGPWTYERLSAVTPVDNVRREIIDGWLYIDGQLVDDPTGKTAAESPRLPHQRAVGRIFGALLSYKETHHGEAITAPMDVRFGSRVLQPDVFWLPEPAHYDVLPIEVLPSLVIEVSSPSTRTHDLVRKRRVYGDAGVPEFWFVDLDGQRIEQYVLADETYPHPTFSTRGDIASSTALPGFSVAVDDVLGPEDPDDQP